MKKILLFLSIIAFLFVMDSCKKDPIDPVDPPEEEVSFLGNYAIQSTHTFGLVPVYDSVGFAIDYEESTSIITDTISISQLSNTDSLYIESLLFSWHGVKINVKATMQNDSLNIIHDYSNSVRNNYIRGMVWLDSDSIFLDYRWDRSDIWSVGAVPEYGKVFSRGVLIE